MINALQELQTLLHQIYEQRCNGCNALKSITLPDTLQSIGFSAFVNTALTAVTIPTGTMVIGSEAFYSTALTTVTIPSNITAIPDRAFSRCAALKSSTRC